MNSLLLAIALTMLSAQAGAAEGGTWLSPDGKKTVAWTRIGPVDKPGDQYALELRRAGQPTARIATFERDVDVIWAADSRHIAITDWAGSDNADCLVADTADPTHPVRLTPLLPTLPETPSNSHFFATCEQWHASSRLLFTVEGRFDSATAPHPFAYGFSYDVAGRRVSARKSH